MKGFTKPKVDSLKLQNLNPLSNQIKKKKDKNEKGTQIQQ